MDVREKLVELLDDMQRSGTSYFGSSVENKKIATHLISNGVTVQEYAEWVHPKEHVVLNGFLCSKCGHQEASHYPINPRPSGGCMFDENGNFYHPPKINYCPNCGAKMMPRATEGGLIMPTCNTCKYVGRPTYKSPCSECKEFSKYEYESKQTNADRIRAMNDEELAKFLDFCESMGYKDSSIATDSDGHCVDMLAWLQQPFDGG